MSESRNKKFTAEYRKQAVALVRDGKTVPEAAQEMGMNQNTLYGWVASDQEEKSVVSHEVYTSVLEENKSLKKEIVRLKEERTILKKAAAYFAQEMQ